VPEQQNSLAASWIGRVLAGHRIEALIGEGGMGMVFRATHLRLRRQVALKLLPARLAADDDFRRRFEREAAIAASLEHPNIVPIYDAGHVDGNLYLSMRYIDGEDLSAVLRRGGPLPVERVCALLGPVADALDAVHEAGLVHRDVKPGNILVAANARRGEQVYLCDFGIAKASAGDHDITSAGQYMGTAQYSSPEQIEGKWLDGRSDQYGLACLAYRCLTGEVPYPRTATHAVIFAHLTAEPPRVTALRPDLPPAVDAAVAKGAAKQPDHRFPTCTAFIEALRAAVIPPRPQPRPRPQPHPRPRPHPAPAPGHAPPAPRPAPGGQPRRVLPPTLPLTEPVAPVPAPAPAPEPVPAPPAAPTPGPTPAPTPDPVPDPAPAPGPSAVPTPLEVRAARGENDPSVTITWTPGGPEEFEYKISRRTPDGRWRVVGRTTHTAIVDGAVPPGAPIPEYEIVARLGDRFSEPVVSTAVEPVEDSEETGDSGFPPVRHLAVASADTLVFDWPDGITEAMVVVRGDRPPTSPDDPAATRWKITNMRYQLDGGLRIPASVPRPCHVAVASCQRDGGALVVAPAFDRTARAVLP